jgi:hypothetical protein
MNKQLTLQDSLMVKEVYTLQGDLKEKRNTKDLGLDIQTHKELVWK